MTATSTTSSVPTRRWHALLAAIAVAAVGVLALASQAHAAGNAYSLDWAAADPAPNSAPHLPTYEKKSPSDLACPTPSGGSGRASDPLTDAVFSATSGAKDAVESLTPEHLALGQVVPFELKVTVSAGANGDLQVNPYFSTKTTSGQNFGFDPSYGIYCAFVDTGDQGTSDPGANAQVTSFSHTIQNPGTSNERIAGTINVNGLNPGDTVIVEVWVVLKDTIPTGTTGNVQTGIDGAREPSSNQTVNVGNQTVPLLQVQKFFTAEADLSVTKADEPDPVTRGSQLTYTITVTNNSSTVTANKVVVTDTLDPNTTFVSASGATCSHSSGTVTCSVGFLAPGASKTITIVTTVGAGAPTGNDPSSGPAAGSAGTTCPSGVDLCNRVSVSSMTVDTVSSNNSYRQPTNVVIEAVTPSLTTNASAGGPVGTTIHDVATLSGGPAGNYTGTITFDLYDNDSCSGSPVTSVTTAVGSGNGSYNSPSYTPALPGSYYWVAKFTSSDPAAADSDRTACDDAAENVVITAKKPSLTTNASAGGPVGTTIHDVATLSGGPAGNYTGTITFDLYDNDSCSGSPVTTVTSSVGSGDGDYASPSYTATAAGTYYWVAKFTSSHATAADSDRTACNDASERVVITALKPDLTTSASPGGPVGTSIHDVATLSGGPAGNYTGTITFDLYDNDSCSGSPVTTQLATVGSGNGSYASSSYTATAAGTYYWVAKFTSSHPDAADSDRTACNDPAEKVRITAPGQVPEADLELGKSASASKAAPGEPVTYTFTVKNNGPDTAHHVTVRDPLSQYLNYVSGDPGCSFNGTEVVCDFGTLLSGQSASKSIVLRLDPSYSPASPPTEHLLDVVKVEGFVSVQGGEFRQATLECSPGYVMSDGSARVDSVDQGSSLDAVHVVGARTGLGNGANDVRSYRFDIENHNAGQAQIHLFGVCIGLETVSGSHQHSLGTPTLVTGAIDANDLAGPERVTKTLTCPNADDVAIAPGYLFQTGSTHVHGPQVISEPSPDGRSWSFGFDVAPDGSRDDVHVDLAIRCLPRTTSSADGHAHALSFFEVDQQVTVPAHSSGDYRVSCPVGYKGIVASYTLPKGLKLIGTTPEPINRDFRLLNTTGQALHAHLDLLCLRSRLGDENNGGSVKNTASVYADEADYNPPNNFSSWVLDDPPATSGTDGSGQSSSESTGGGSAPGGGGSGSQPAGAADTGTPADGAALADARPADGAGAPAGLRIGDRITRSGKVAMVPLYGGDEATAGRLTLKVSKKRIGSASFELDAGEDAFVDVKLSKKGRKLIRKARSVTVVVEIDGEAVEQTLRIAR